MHRALHDLIDLTRPQYIELAASIPANYQAGFERDCAMVAADKFQVNDSGIAP
jgi:hypothetical protein